MTQSLCTLSKVPKVPPTPVATPPILKRGFVHPLIQVGTPHEYLDWVAKARAYLREFGKDPTSLERVDATFNYSRNRILLFNLPDEHRELTVAETLSHEILHSLFEQMDERWAARTLDQVATPVGDPNRVGGI
ncbi:MAG: hypothetical protein WB778_02045 [Thermoplasmata archaeon]